MKSLGPLFQRTSLLVMTTDGRLESLEAESVSRQVWEQPHPLGRIAAWIHADSSPHSAARSDPPYLPTNKAGRDASTSTAIVAVDSANL